MAVVHFLFLIFVMLGAFLVWRWPALIWLHAPAAAWGALVLVMHWPCPLTPLENRLRRRGGASTYSQGFLAHYFGRHFCPDGLTPGVRILISVTVIVVNVALYVAIIARLI